MRRTKKRLSAEKHILIVNPRSGQGRYAEHLDFVRSYFAKRGIPLDIRLTERPGHATELAQDAVRSGYGVVIGAGGDGTINEVLNGIAGTNAKLAILPWGTGNVFALEMGFPRRLSALCKVIAAGRSRRLDLGLCNGRRFLMMCGMGFDAYSLRQLESQELKKRAGILAYLFGGMRAFSRYKHPEIEVVFPDGRVESCRYALVSNTSRYGVFFSLSPRARADDGILDLFMYKGQGAFALLRLVCRVALSALGLASLEGPDPFLRKVAARKVTALIIRSDSAVPIQLDGDLAGNLPASISVIPSAIECILPKNALRKTSVEPIFPA